MERRRVLLGGASVDLMSKEEALRTIVTSAGHAERPLGVASANLDHVFHFGRGGRWHGVLADGRGTDWLTLLDGHPLVRQADRLTGGTWPRLAGSDLIEDLLSRAEAEGIVVGFLGGTSECHRLLQARLRRDWPRLSVGGCWAPDRAEIEDPRRSRMLAAEVRASGVRMLFVGLGKPRQELWIAEHGHATGAGVLLAFGAAADFVAGTARRAPGLIARGGAEWLWRLGHEPRRLARRYLGEEPGAYIALRTSSSTRPGHPPSEPPSEPPSDLPAEPRPVGDRGAGSSPERVTAVVVTYNSAARIGPLLVDLDRQVGGPPLQVVVVDNGSTDETRDIVRNAGTAKLVEAGANLGYAAGVNLGLSHVPPGEGVLILNPDLRVPRDTLASLWARLQAERAGAVVPAVLDEHGSLSPSLRFEPGLLRDLGDALLGSHLATRPPWATETDFSPDSYRWPHRVEWATGAALLVSPEVVADVGPWREEFFLYSEETDFFRRVREASYSIWFEPTARVTHVGAASGSSPRLDALRAVNRVRYAELHHAAAYTRLEWLVVLLSALVRVRRAEGHRCAVHYLLHRDRWTELAAGLSAGRAAGAPARVT